MSNPEQVRIARKVIAEGIPRDLTDAQADLAGEILSDAYRVLEEAEAD